MSALSSSDKSTNANVIVNNTSFGANGTWGEETYMNIGGTMTLVKSTTSNEVDLINRNLLGINDLELREQSTLNSTPISGHGYLWAKNTTPSTLWFTDDTGIDYQLGLTSSGGGISSVTTTGCITGDGTGGNPITLLLNPSGGLECGPSGLQLVGVGYSQVYSYQAGNAPSGATVPQAPADNPVEGTIQVEVFDDCINFWVYSSGWVLDKDYCPSTATGRKGGLDSLIAISGVQTINFDASSYDNKRAILNSDVVVTLSATRGGFYGLRLLPSGGGTRNITWATSVNGGPPSVISGAFGTVLNLFYDNIDGSWHI